VDQNQVKNVFSPSGMVMLHTTVALELEMIMMMTKLGVLLRLIQLNIMNNMSGDIVNQPVSLKTNA
jgi:hypothetical protein